ADGGRAQCGRSEHRQHRRLGPLRQIAVIPGEADARRERVIDHLESLGQKRANFRIPDRFCRRRADRKAAARAILAAEIAGQSLAIQAPQHLAQRPIVGERFFHREVAEFPVAPERGEVELALVTERAIEARPIHAGRCAQIVERGRCVAGAPEAFGGALQRDLGIVGARPAPRPRFRSLWLFLYHFARNPLTQGTTFRIIIRNGTKNNGDGTWICISPHWPVRWPPALRSMRLVLRHVLSRSTRKPNAPATAPTIGRSTRWAEFR